jgi:phosphate transport system substrate-binding protein
MIKRTVLTALITLGLLLPGFIAAQKMVQIKGSDTLVNLVQILSENFMAENPRTAIAVLGGGSGTGIAGLINGTCDIANHSRPMKSSEEDLCRRRGVDYRTFVVAIDGLSVIIHKNNPVNELPMDTIGAIYRGEITNWKDVGGPDMTISLYGRQSNSGTFVFFQEHVLGNQDYADTMKRMNGNAQIVEGVMNDKAAIGYVGVGYIVDSRTGQSNPELTVLNVSKDEDSKSFSPLDKESVNSGDYPVSRPLFMTSSGAPRGVVVDLMKYILSEKGQKVIVEEGFFPIGKGILAENMTKLK